MAFLHNESPESLTSALDLWTVPMTQVAVESSYFVHYKPLTSLEGANVIEFAVPGNGNEYIDPAHSLLYVKFKIVNADGSAVVSTTAEPRNVGIVNYPIGSLWSQCDVSLNQKVISQSSLTYNYRSYIEALLAYDLSAKQSHLTSRLWYADTPGYMDSLTEKENKGLDVRRDFVNNSRVCEIIGQIHSDLFNQERFILNNVELRVKLTKNKDSFVIMSSKGGETVKILDASFIVRKVKLSPGVLLGHAKALEQKPALYPLTRVEVKNVTIASGLQDKSIDNLYLGQLPTRIIVGFVRNTSYNGSYTLNGFNFEHFLLNYLTLHVDSEQYPSKALTPNYQTNEYVESFHTLFSGSGIHSADEGNALELRDYPRGYTLYCFDITPDLSSSENHWVPQRQGTVRLEVRFAEKLEQAVNCIVYAEFRNLIQIDKHRSVLVDFSA